MLRQGGDEGTAGGGGTATSRRDFLIGVVPRAKALFATRKKFLYSCFFLPVKFLYNSCVPKQTLRIVSGRYSDQINHRSSKLKVDHNIDELIPTINDERT